MSEINVTPFVDVMLVLLIIFMVAAPLLTVGVEINLPKTSANALPTEKEQPLTLSITKEKELYLQETKIEFSDLIPKLKQISKQ
jgi:biopolymer transport protein TolR